MAESVRGVIPTCHESGCGYRCCDFSRGNYIVLYPGELNEAVSAGAALGHLEIRPSSDGGHRAICHACDTGCCDGGYKPLDCASYPFFPTIDSSDQQVRSGLASPKCPLLLSGLREHRQWVARQWRSLAARSYAVRRWLGRVTLVDYRSLPDAAPD